MEEIGKAVENLLSEASESRQRNEELKIENSLLTGQIKLLKSDLKDLRLQHDASFGK